ncbi:MAG: DNA-binding NarL/FixJ family response regulator, partial [Gammaproteobacteria bacterium]
KRLSLSYKTVANYTTQIKSKLEVTTIAELARMAISHDIVQV